MPEKTYTLTFVHSDRSEIEQQEHTNIGDARAAFRLFDSPDSADIYESITLTEYDWKECRETVLATISF